MILAGAGHSSEASTADAVTAAVGEALEEGGTEAADLVFLFATFHHGAQADCMLEIAGEESGTEAVVGCSGLRVLTGAGENERDPGIAVLALAGDGLDAVPFLARGEGAAAQIGDRIGDRVSEESVLVLMPDIHFHPAELISGLQEVTGDIPIVGAAASGHPMEERTLQWCGREVAGDGVAGVLLSGGVRVVTGVAQGCHPFGQAYTVTRAEENVIQEIAFSPAVDALKEALDTLMPEQKAAVGQNVFIGLAMDEYATDRRRGDFLVRNLLGMDPDTGALAVGERVEVGQTVQFNLRTADAAREDIEQVTSHLADEAGGLSPKFGLYFNCLGRGFGLYGQPDYDVSVIRKHLGSFPLAGFFGNAEFAPVGGKNFVHSYTGALVLFSEEE